QRTDRALDAGHARPRAAGGHRRSRPGPGALPRLRGAARRRGGAAARGRLRSAAELPVTGEDGAEGRRGRAAQRTPRMPRATGAEIASITRPMAMVTAPSAPK